MKQTILTSISPLPFMASRSGSRSFGIEETKLRVVYYVVTGDDLLDVEGRVEFHKGL